VDWQAFQVLRATTAPGRRLNLTTLTLGVLLNASHASLRDDFEVSSTALNAIVECAQQQSACHGARMTGIGFGGCAVSAQFGMSREGIRQAEARALGKLRKSPYANRLRGCYGDLGTARI